METQEITAAQQTQSPMPSPPPISMWQSIRESLRGTHQDFTTGNLNRAIVLLAIPMVLEMVLESLFAVVDVFFVGKLGADAVATVGLTEAMLFIIYAIAMGLGIGATALVARRIGERDPSGAAKTAVQSIVLGVMVGAMIGIVGVTMAPAFLRGLGAPPDVLQVGTS